MPFTVITDNMGVFGLLKQMKDNAKNPSPRMPIQRWLDHISGFQITKVIHRTTREVFTSDGLSLSFWLEMAYTPKETGAWAIPETITKKEEGEELAAREKKEKIQRVLIAHCRHTDCPLAKEGFHSWQHLQEVLQEQSGIYCDVMYIQEVMRDSERAIVTKDLLGSSSIWHRMNGYLWLVLLHISTFF